MAKKILIVDDMEDTRELLKIFIEEFGYETVEAEDGYEAVSKVKQEKPDLILMDIALPGLDGLSATQIIRGFTDVHQMPIIAITAHSDSYQRKAIEAGCNDLIIKPIYANALVAILNQYLGSMPTNP